MSNPVNVALYGHRSIPLVMNTSTGSQGAVDRVQSFRPSMSVPTRQHRELGRVGAVGTSASPLATRLTLQQNLVDSFELEWILTGKPLAPAGAQTYTLGDMLTYADLLKVFLLNRNQDGTILSELELGGLSVTEIVWNFPANGDNTLDISFAGRTALEYAAGAVIHSSWPTLDNTSLGGIAGREARLWLSSGSGATDRIYRVQSAQIRAAFPVTPVPELGNRNLAGHMTDGPDVSLTFDMMPGDQQPVTSLFTQTASITDFAQPTSPTDMYLRVFDPAQAEGLKVIRAIKVDNCVATGASRSSQVRGISTAQYTLVSASEDTTDSGGITVSNRNLGG